jgi:glycosyltransferase involved in cell wall biosynthesis
MSVPPLVSVIMIFLNEECFIDEAIQSVMMQTYKNWELLLVDDGSVNESTAIARGYAQRLPGKVRYLEHENHQNRGMSAARNLGLAHAQGEFIAFLDADDVWLPQMLKTHVNTLVAQPEAAMVYGPTQWWYSWTGNAAAQPLDFIHDLGVPSNMLLRPPQLVARFIQREGISPCTCSVLLRHEVFEQVGGFEEGFRGLYEDQAFFSKVCLQSPVFVSQECLARYRQHPDSNCVVAQSKGEYPAARSAFLKWLLDYLSAQDKKKNEVWDVLQKEMRRNMLSDSSSNFRRGTQGFLKRIFHLLQRIRLRLPGLPFLRHLRSLQLRRLQPFGNGRQQGTPVVRYYWENFLQRHKLDVHGAALEIGTSETIRRMGGEAVSRADAIDLSAHSPEITVLADLSRADHLPSDCYDCFINQFTMHLIYNSQAALYHSIRILKPGGVLLVNFPCVDYYFPRGLDMGTGEPLFLYWWFTPIQVENLLQRIGLRDHDYSLEIYGNLFARVAYQMNLPAEELTRRELEYKDPGHPLLICVRVVKPTGWQAEAPPYQEPWRPVVTPARWNAKTGHYSV